MYNAMTIMRNLYQENAKENAKTISKLRLEKQEAEMRKNGEDEEFIKQVIASQSHTEGKDINMPSIFNLERYEELLGDPSSKAANNCSNLPVLPGVGSSLPDVQQDGLRLTQANLARFEG